MAQALVAKDARHGDLTRTWLQFDPPGTEPPRAVLLLLHGNGGSAAGLMGEPGKPTAFGRWLEIAARERLLLLVADGTPGSSGNRGFNDCRGDAQTNPDVDDSDWLGSLVERASAPVGKPLPVLASGFSNGGHMALRLAIERPQQLLAVAAVAAAMPARSECAAPQRGVNVVLMNGTRDSTLPYEGGAVGSASAPRGTALSAEQSLGIWTMLIGAPAVA